MFVTSKTKLEVIVEYAKESSLWILPVATAPLPKFIINEEVPDNFSDKVINQALAFTRNLLINKFYTPNNLYLPRSRVVLENCFS